MLNCVIIDDEQFSIDALVKYIDEMPGLGITGIYTDPRTALEQMSSRPGVEIIFMDVNMPLISGLELAGLLRSRTQKLIFTTSYSKYAFQAYESGGDAYLLKPYTFAKFSATINRLFPAVEFKAATVSAGLDDHFLVKSKEDNLRVLRVAYLEVLAFESLQNYVRIYLEGDRTLITYLTLKDVAELLKVRPEFKQFHRAFIISVNAINYIEGTTIKLKNDLTINVGESYKDNFTAYLSGKLLLTQRKK